MQSIKNVIIFSGGNIENPEIIKNKLPFDAYVICADSGVFSCENFGFNADLIVGDFDSADYNNVVNLKCAKSSEFIKLNPVKDDTDTEYAITLALKFGAANIYLVGGLGTRADHSLANIMLMEKCFKHNCKMTVINENNTLHYIKNSTLIIENTPHKYISVIPLEPAVISNLGFLYSLDREELYRDSSRGISNELIDKKGSITVHSGSVIICESDD